MILFTDEFCRAENIQLQMKIRELESCRDCYTVVGTVVPVL